MKRYTEIERFDGSALLVESGDGKITKTEFPTLVELQGYLETNGLKSHAAHHHRAGIKGGANGDSCRDAPKKDGRRQE